MVKVGDNHWYGKTVPQNITFAAEMYAEAASKNNLPQVILISSLDFPIFQPIRDFNLSGNLKEHSKILVRWYVGLT